MNFLKCIYFKNRTFCFFQISRNSICRSKGRSMFIVASCILCTSPQTKAKVFLEGKGKHFERVVSTMGLISINGNYDCDVACTNLRNIFKMIQRKKDNMLCREFLRTINRHVELYNVCSSSAGMEEETVFMKRILGWYWYK